MPNSNKMKDVVQSYFSLFNAQDSKGITDLFADDAVVTDPVGTDPKEGKAAISEFYDMAVKNGAVLHQQGPTRIAGNSAAFAFEVTVGGEGITDADAAVDVELPKGAMLIEVIDVFEFNEDNKVTAMRAYWGAENITQS